MSRVGGCKFPLMFAGSLAWRTGMVSVSKLSMEKLRVRSYQAVIKAIQAEVRKYVPTDVSLAEDLIADRRAAAARE